MNIILERFVSKSLKDSVCLIKRTSDQRALLIILKDMQQHENVLYLSGRRGRHNSYEYTYFIGTSDNLIRVRTLVQIQKIRMESNDIYNRIEIRHNKLVILPNNHIFKFRHLKITKFDNLAI